MNRLVIIFALLCCCDMVAQHVTEVVIQDHKKTKASFIRKISNIEEGTILDSTVYEGDIARLKRLPGIAHAYYQVHAKKDGNYTITYGVE
ncbi:MAG: outer membrane protein assembly factor, partial [Bacteroidetes bacterium]|nr:outer membrane protein assembly factor [Bacteroidota bacterium]